MPDHRRIDTSDDAEALLAELRAPERLVKHGRLVLGAADELLGQMRESGVILDDRLVRVGAMLHDAGKILNPEEVSGGGARHERAGERLLLEHGIDPAIARCCVTHANWATMNCFLEELLVALADALWKGVRREALEKKVIEEVARRLGVKVWSIFVELDTCFERIADGGEERLRRSA
jgi:HD superfamily phosphodiesterase